MNKILRITLGSLGLLIVLLLLIYLAVKDVTKDSNPDLPVTPIIVGTTNPYHTRVPLSPVPSAEPSAERTMDPASGTNLPQYTVPASYSNLPAPEGTPGEANG